MNEQRPGTTALLEEHPPAVTANNGSAQMPAPAGPPSGPPTVTPTVPHGTPAVPVSTVPTIRRRSPWGMVAVFSLCSALAGAGIGYAMGLPGRSDLRDQRDAALAELDTADEELEVAAADLSSARVELTSIRDQLATVREELGRSNGDLDAALVDLAQVRSDLETSRADLAAVRSDVTDVTKNRDDCLAAAGAGLALVDDWNDVLTDIFAYLNSPLGSAEEARLDAHIYDQLGDMDQAYLDLNDQVETCRAG